MVDTIRTKEYAHFVGKLRKARLEAGLRQIDLQNDVSEIKKDVLVLKTDMTEVKKDVQEIKSDLKQKVDRTEFARLERRVISLESIVHSGKSGR